MVSLKVSVPPATVRVMEREGEALGERDGLEMEGRPVTDGEVVAEAETLMLVLTVTVGTGLRVMEVQEEAEVESVRVPELASERLCVAVLLLLREMRGDPLLE